MNAPVGNTVSTAVNITHPIIHPTPIPRSIITVPLPPTATMSFTVTLLPHRGNTHSRDNRVIITAKIWVCLRMRPIRRMAAIRIIAVSRTAVIKIIAISRTAVIRMITIIGMITIIRT